jgi:taurine dioxygenase
MVGQKSKIHIKPYSPNLGAVVKGVDLASGLTDEEYEIIQQAFWDYQVLFFQEQKEISPVVQVKIGKMFGPLHKHPAAPTMKGHPEIFEIHTHKDSKVANGNLWHTDVSCDKLPPLGTMLQLHVLPECGGDTIFASMYSAYQRLSSKLKELLSDLEALHVSEHLYKGRYADRGVADRDLDYPSAVHPVLRTHPETGRKAIYVNRTFTREILGIAKAESQYLLNFLWDHCEQVDFQVRYRWNKNDLVFWDNRCLMHHAVWDYWPAERKGRRVTIKGDRPN